VLIGAGTVLTVENVDRLYDVGGNILVTPNTDPDVIRAAGDHGMVTMIGAFTPTEALTAIKSGASAIKFFPANVLGPKGIAGIKSILPPDVPIGAVGGVSEVDFGDYMKVGVSAFGLGSSLYKPGATALDVAARAKLTIEAYDKAVSA
jgi:2-dehydro-3-deoxyphosphogalactonate aldolase